MKNKYFDQTVRLSFAHVPSFIQPLLTFISGQPLPHEKPLFKISPLFSLLIDIGKFLIGIMWSIYNLSLPQHYYFLLFFSYILTVNGARSLASDAHYGAHGCLTGNRKIDFWIGEVISAIVLSQNMLTYAKPHKVGHHGKFGIFSEKDPDSALLSLMKFKLGQAVKWYWKKMFFSIFSPIFHFNYTKLRIKSNLFDCSSIRMGITLVIHGLILFLVSYENGWKIYFFAFFIPMIFLVPISAVLQFCSEHVWLSQKKNGESQKAFIHRLSHGRFCLFMAPKKSKSSIVYFFRWVIWSFKMLYQLFCRFFILVSILPAHDYHHRHAHKMNWPMEPYLRQAEIDSGESDYINYYNIIDAYIALFTSLSECSPSNENLG